MNTPSDFERELKRIGLPHPRREVDERILEPGADLEGPAAPESNRPALVRFGVVATLAGMAALVLISVLHLLLAGSNVAEPEDLISREAGRVQVEAITDDQVVIDLCQGGSADGFLDAKLARDLERGLAAIRRVDPDLVRVQRELAYAYRYRDAQHLGLQLPQAAATRVMETLRKAGNARPVDSAAQPRPAPTTGLAPLDQLNRRLGVIEVRPCPPHANCLELRFAGPRDTWRLARIYQDALAESAPGTHAGPVFRPLPDDRLDRRRGRYLVALTRRGEQLDLEVYFEDRPGEVLLRRFAYHPATNQVSRVRPDPTPVARRMDAVMLAVDWQRTRVTSAPHITPRAMDAALAEILQQRPGFAAYRPLPSIWFPPVSAAFAPPRVVALGSEGGRIRCYFRDLELKVQTALDGPIGRR